METEVMDVKLLKGSEEAGLETHNNKRWSARQRKHPTSWATLTSFTLISAAIFLHSALAKQTPKYIWTDNLFVGRSESTAED